jgi:hypothetical protein
MSAAKSSSASLERVWSSDTASDWPMLLRSTSSLTWSVMEARSSLRPSSVSPPASTTRLRRILRLTSWSLMSTPAELSSASVLSRTPFRAAEIRERWVKPRLPPSPTTWQRSSCAFTRTGSLVVSPASAWVSSASLT